MKYKLTRKKDSVKIDFTVPAEEWAKAIDEAYEQNKKKFSVPGFRKGKVPKNVIMRMYGEGVFYDDAFNALINKGYGMVLDNEPDFYPVARPDVDFDKFTEDGGVKFHATVVVKPEVELGEYKGLALDKAVAKVSAKEVAEEIDRARERAARKEPVTDRACAMGDIVNIDYSGAIDGKKFDGGTAERQDLELGSKTFIPGFEEGVVGMQIGETRDVKVAFPDTYHAKDLAGKDAIFTVTLHTITAKTVPAADDAFAQDVSKFETFADYKADVKKRLTEAAENRAKNENENAILKAVTDNAKVAIPDAMIETQLDNIIRDFEYRLMYQGMKLDDYFKYTNSTMEDMRAARREEAEQGVKTRLVVEAIIKAEGIEVTDADVEAKIADIAKLAGKPVDEYKATLDETRIDYIKNDLLMDKVFAFLFKATAWVTPTAKKKAAKAD